MRFKLNVHPKPAAPGFAAGKEVPEFKANPISRTLFSWLDQFLYVGYTRPLQHDDLWALPKEFLASNVTDEVEKRFYERCPIEKRPLFMRKDTRISGTEENIKTAEGTEFDRSTEAKSSGDKTGKDQKHDSYFIKALHRTFFVKFWISGIFRFSADTLKTTTPLVTRLLFAWLTETYVFNGLTDQQRVENGITSPKGIGYGIGLSFAIFSMQELASLFTNHSLQGGMAVGMLTRSSIISLVFRKSLRLSGRARQEHSVGKITTMISTDSARLERFIGQHAHIMWTGPIQLIIGVALLIATLGYSALVGIALLILAFPIQGVIIKFMIAQRIKVVGQTDKRVRLTTEILQGIRLLKFYAWEDYYVEKLVNIRAKELVSLQNMANCRAFLFSFVTLVPILASVLSFITYALTRHDLNIAIIFSSLQYFNILRTNLMYLPLVFGALGDMLVALQRISSYLQAEELDEPYKLDYLKEFAVDVDADFQWESVRSQASGISGSNRDNALDREYDDKSRRGEKDNARLPTAIRYIDSTVESGSTETDEKPFALKELRLQVPRNRFVAIVGPIASGKSSLLQALIGEMRRTRGEATLGGTVAYVPQIAWIRNATVRQNILFGQQEDESRLRDVVRACSLEHDIETLPHGIDTEIGEKGINLSGGQKARVSLARAVYSSSDIICLDDPFAAVDAHVGKSILEDCLLNGPLASRTRILVTHALHVLNRTDYIYVMDKGTIKEAGSFADLMSRGTLFAQLMREHGREEEEKLTAELSSTVVNQVGFEKGGSNEKIKAATLMTKEERVTGAVTWATYSKYFRFAGGLGGLLWVPVIVTGLSLTQAASIGYNIFLSLWTAGSIPGFSQGEYMLVYSMLGVAQAVFTFINITIFTVMSIRASLRIFRAAVDAVLSSRIAFFDTTPIGRITSRLSKDMDVLDTELPLTAIQFLQTLWSVFGTIALVFYIFPLLGIIFVPMALIYGVLSKFYRATSVETKRLDSINRSVLYGSFTESLTGLAVIRAYGLQDRSVKDAQNGIDKQNQAYYMTISIQRWLAVRLDLFGSMLVLSIGLFASGFRTSINPGKVGVVLTYTLDITQVFSLMIAQYAQNEQNMNAVERVLVYTDLSSETRSSPSIQYNPPASWPTKGAVTFEDVTMAYRHGLPAVLKKISFGIRPGEKIAVAGRTGAGKSSLLQAFFRIVELNSGRILVDDQDISQIDLKTLRQRFSLVPQDTNLFMGTLRSNIDPMGSRTDAELISILQKASLLPSDGTTDLAAEAKFSLDSPVSDEGTNYSVGEKQLIALCRALVKSSRIIILDEATSSVDVETDAKIQRTIQNEFGSSTLICIAHRLNTIAYYDRVIVMDQGQVAEFDEVIKLFDKSDSLFRGLCDEARLTKEDIVNIRASHFRSSA